jgi:hypothetical protein
VRVGPLTLFTLIQHECQPEGLLTRLQLALGELWVILKGGTLEVEVPGGSAAVRGSYMGAQVQDGQTRITCRKGVCSLRNAAGTAFLLTGQAGILPGDGQGIIRLEELRPDEIRR